MNHHTKWHSLYIPGILLAISMTINSKNIYRKMPSRRLVSLWLILAFLVNTFGPIPSYAQIDLPLPGQMVEPTSAYAPALVKGLVIDPSKPLQMDFLIDPSQTSQINKKEEYRKLAQYFLAALTVPEKDLWVNLSPYEKDRIVPQEFGKTQMGRDLLAQDYILKQLTASLIYPEKELGKTFWKKVYAQAQEKFGRTDIPVNTFNKVWIVPDKAVVYEKSNGKNVTAYIVEGHLKVMLEEDYLALQKNFVGDGSPVPNKGGETPPLRNQIGSNIIRQIVLPAIEREVNEGKNFANLRQINNALILATWYKKRLKESILGKLYVDQNKTPGIEYPSPTRGHVQTRTTKNVSPSTLPNDVGLNVKATQSNEPTDVEYIYHQYLQAFKKGVYNYIKEEPNPITHQITPRKYFSGGYSATDDQGKSFVSHLKTITTLPSAAITTLAQSHLDRAQVSFQDTAKPDPGMASGVQVEQLVHLAVLPEQEFFERSSNIIEAAFARGQETINRMTQDFQLSKDTDVLESKITEFYDSLVNCTIFNTSHESANVLYIEEIYRRKEHMDGFIPYTYDGFQYFSKHQEKLWFKESIEQLKVNLAKSDSRLTSQEIKDLLDNVLRQYFLVVLANLSLRVFTDKLDDNMQVLQRILDHIQRQSNPSRVYVQEASTLWVLAISSFIDQNVADETYAEFYKKIYAPSVAKKYQLAFAKMSVKANGMHLHLFFDQDSNNKSWRQILIENKVDIISIILGMQILLNRYQEILQIPDPTADIIYERKEIVEAIAIALSGKLLPWLKHQMGPPRNSWKPVDEKVYRGIIKLKSQLIKDIISIDWQKSFSTLKDLIFFPPLGLMTMFEWRLANPHSSISSYEQLMTVLSGDNSLKRSNFDAFLADNGKVQTLQVEPIQIIEEILGQLNNLGADLPDPAMLAVPKNLDRAQVNLEESSKDAAMPTSLDTVNDLLDLLGKANKEGTLISQWGVDVQSYAKYSQLAIYYFIRDVVAKTGFAKPISVQTFPTKINSLFGLPKHRGGFAFKYNSLAKTQFFVLEEVLQDLDRSGKLIEYGGLENLDKLVKLLQSRDTSSKWNLSSLTPLLNKNTIRIILGHEIKGWTMPRIDMSYDNFEIICQWLKKKAEEELREYGSMKGLIQLLEEISGAREGDPLATLKGINLGQLTGLLSSTKNIKAITGYQIDLWSMPKIDMPYESYEAISQWLKEKSKEELNNYGSMEGLIKLIEEIKNATEKQPLAKLKKIGLGGLTSLLNSPENIESITGYWIDDWNMPKVAISFDQYDSISEWLKGKTKEQLREYGSMKGLIKLLEDIDRARKGDPLVTLKGMHLGQLTGLLRSSKNIKAITGYQIDFWAMPKIELSYEQYQTISHWIKEKSKVQLREYGNMGGLIKLIQEIDKAAEFEPLGQLKGIYLGHLTGLLNSSENIEAISGHKIDDWGMPKMNMGYEEYKIISEWLKRKGEEELSSYGSMEGLIKLLEEIDHADKKEPLAKLKGMYLGGLTILLNSPENIRAITGYQVDSWVMPKVEMSYEQYKSISEWLKSKTKEELETYGSMKGLIQLIEDIRKAPKQDPLAKLRGMYIGHLTGLLNSPNNIKAITGYQIDNWAMPFVRMSYEQYEAISEWLKGKSKEQLSEYGSMEGLTKLITEINKAGKLDPLARWKGVNLGNLTGLLNSPSNIEAITGYKIDTWAMPVVQMSYERYEAISQWLKEKSKEQLSEYGSMEGLIRLIKEINKASTLEPLAKLKRINLGGLTGLLNSPRNIEAITGHKIDTWNMPYMVDTWDQFIKTHGIKDTAMTGEAVDVSRLISDVQNEPVVRNGFLADYHVAYDAQTAQLYGWQMDLWQAPTPVDEAMVTDLKEDHERFKAALEGTTAEQVLEGLGIRGLDHTVFIKAEKTPFGTFKRYRMHLPSAPTDRYPQGTEILTTEFKAREVDLIIVDDRLIGIVSVKDNNKGIEPVGAINFSAYYAPLFNQKTAQDQQTLINYFDQIEKDTNILSSYINDVSLEGVDSPLKSMHGLAFVGINMQGKLIVSLNYQKYSSGEWKEKWLFPILPTVYVPNKVADESYYQEILNNTNIDIKPDDDVLIAGPGSGMDSWLAAHHTKKPIHIIGINPLEIINTKLVARITGFNVDFQQHDRLLRQGQPVFGAQRFQRFLWNMPYVSLNENGIGRFSKIHDGYAGTQLIIDLANALPQVLDPKDNKILLWNRKIKGSMAPQHSLDYVDSIFTQEGFKVTLLSLLNELFTVHLIQKDQAMLVNQKAPGGIDLNPANNNFQIKKDANGIPILFSTQSIDNIRLKGLTPVVVSITPVMNLPEVLGVASSVLTN